ncbi:MAG: broad specificity phosphatase PhoE [Zhongshania marina]|jgi:broad specificity phosphatase PhoE|uniref:Histidine phosphatase family protein n=1 Tax=Zhongshania marina TaxID=2304603 RepID=A0ABX9W8H7_9GAMM|nr:histidine phosphatase family protein [Zhongshania marina]
MPALYLIRHGQASFGAEDYDQLSDLGMRQSQHVGEYFSAQGIQPDTIICGGMKRHRQTAEQCLNAMGLGAKFVDTSLWSTNTDWNEYDHLQILEAYTALPGVGEMMVQDMAGENPKAGFQKHFSHAMQRWCGGEYDHEYRETWSAFCSRIERGLAAAGGASGNVFVFTSGGAISAVSRQLLQLNDMKALSLSWMLANAAYSKVLVGKSGAVLASMNEHGHFDGKYRDLLSYR